MAVILLKPLIELTCPHIISLALASEGRLKFENHAHGHLSLAWILDLGSCESNKVWAKSNLPLHLVCGCTLPLGKKKRLIETTWYARFPGWNG